MGIKYDLTDLINNMIELETVGAQFYARQARLATHPLVGPLFARVAAQEQRHRVVYTGFLKEFGGEVEVDDEYRDFLRGIIGRKFTFDHERAARCNDPVAAIDMGIELEKDSIHFIDAFGRLAADRHLDVVSQIRAEEESHLTQLLDLRQIITARAPAH